MFEVESPFQGYLRAGFEGRTLGTDQHVLKVELDIILNARHTLCNENEWISKIRGLRRMQIKCLPCTEQEKQFWLPFGGRPTRFRDAWFDPVLPSMRPLTRMAIINADRCPKDHFMVRQLVLLFCMRLMSTSITSYIGRLAPSPSGHLHGKCRIFVLSLS